MELTIEQLSHQYYETIKDKFPNLTKDMVHLMCRSPLLFIKQHMKNPDFPTIQIKHLGKFTVRENRVKKLLVDNDKDLHFKNISQETYERRKAGFEAILARYVRKSESEKLQIIDDTDELD